ncbi:MAG: peptidase T [Solobacterium sp.]|nr:peptidase T [Solobacterium sp.]
MSAAERLIRYCKIDTQSDPKSPTSPSTQKQFDLAKVLEEELKEIGLEDVYLDEYCNVYAHMPANLDKSGKTIGFIAHMDTSPDYNGANVNPRIIPAYDGKDIALAEGVVTRIKDFPKLSEHAGHDLMVTDGSSLLGADDKAGITAIMEALVYWKEHPETPHCRIAVAFTPDEEIGRGTEHFDLERFDAAFAYTMDGGDIRTITDETFNAAEAVVTFRGFSIHPGSAKNKLISAVNLAMEYHALLPEHMRPEHTEGKEGYIHVTEIKGTTENAVMEYILRDHDRQKLEDKIELMNRAASWINARYGEGSCNVEIIRGYRNMKEILNHYPEVMGLAEKALLEMGLQPVSEGARGGTDGASLSFMGLPCPNLGTGGGNAHGRYEFCDLWELEQSSILIRKIAETMAGGEYK